MIGFFTRMRRYLGEMFPLSRHLMLSMMIYLSVAYFAAQLSRADIILLSTQTLIGVGSVLGLFLMLRLMDELKDYDLDKVLFPDRPICTGMVLVSDIRIALAVVTVALLGLNLLAGVAFWSAVAMVGFAYLMFRHFFARDLLRSSLPVTLATHQPIIPLLLIHCFMVQADDNPQAWQNLDLTIPYLVLLWMPFLGWEISRKIRSPRDETDYVTYSKLFGPRQATHLALGIQAIPLMVAIYLFIALQTSMLYPALMVIAYLIYLRPCVRFLRNIDQPATSIKGYAQLYLIAVLSVQIVEFAVLSGV